MLTAKQEEFAKAIVEGMNQADAYRSAYDTSKMSDNSIYVNASKLMDNTKVAQRINELRGQLTAKTIMSAQKRLEWLTEQIESENVDINAKLKAVDIMNKMQGEYVQKIAAEVQTETTINIELVEEE